MKCQCGNDAVYQVKMVVGNEVNTYDLCAACYRLERQQAAAYGRRPTMMPVSQPINCYVCGAPVPVRAGVQRVTCGRSCTISYMQTGLPVVNRALPSQPRPSMRQS
jgi:hypothetical protein